MSFVTGTESNTFVLGCFFCLANLNAQVTFNPGFRGGVNFNHFSKGDQAYYNDGYTSDRNFETKTDFYLGFYGALKLSKFYTLQPEINYSAQGSQSNSNYSNNNNYYYNNNNYYIDINDFNDNNNNNNKSYNVDYLSFVVINKFTFNDKFNIHLGPTMDFVVSKNFNNRSDVDLAFILGAGYQITPNFGVEVRVKKGIVPVIVEDDNRTNVVFSVGGTYTFDLK